MKLVAKATYSTQTLPAPLPPSHHPYARECLCAHPQELSKNWLNATKQDYNSLCTPSTTLECYCLDSIINRRPT